jgi:type I restriction enzyme S subunit
MAYKQVLLGDYFKFEKGLGYKGEFLVEDSEVALIGMDSHEEGGGYKEGSEKPYSGPYKPEHVAETGDVIFAATDLTQGGDVLGSPLMVPESDKFETFIYSHHLLKAFQKREGFLPEYLYNLYRVKKYRRKAAYGDSGSTVRALPADVLEEQLIPLPDLKTQESINEVISLIDQQIENNKSLAKNLEALAQSIFRSWFVDFEPVHAKARGEKPFGMDDETAALFPDSFEESESGLIPRGWKISKFSEGINLISGGTPKTSEPAYWDGEIPWYSVTDAPKDGMCFFTKTSKHITSLGLSKSAAKLVRPGVTIISARGTVGKLAIVSIPSVFNQSCYGVEGLISDSFTYFQLKGLVSKMKNVAHGGTFDTITKNTFDIIEVVEPSKHTINEYEKYAGPLLKKIEQLNHEIDSLKSLSDSLLSNLIQLGWEIPKDLVLP